VRVMFGVLSLVIVVGVVASLARKQVQAVGMGTTGHAAATVGETPASVVGADGRTVSGQARSIEQKARDDVAQALKKGADRVEHADP
jgi:hypothetical protein